MKEEDLCEVEGCEKVKHIFSDKYCGYHRGVDKSGRDPEKEVF